MRTGEAAIALEGVRKSYGGAKGKPVLDGLDLTVARGSVHGLLGPNGAGKTTAVRIMTTLLAPDAGRVTVAGLDAVRDSARVRAQIGLVGQYAAVDEALSGRQNLVMFARLNRYRPPSARRRAEELLERFGLVEAADRQVKTYSGGMRRRVDLAAGLITAPDILFVDEPTTGLDPGVRQDVWAAIRDLVRGGTTVLLTTQYLEEADQLADQISMLGRGRVVAEGSPTELKAKAGDDWLEVTPAHDTDLARLRAELSAWSSGDVTMDHGLIRVPLADRASSLIGATAALRDADLKVRDLSLRTPTLDEVFLQVTGHTALDTAEPDDNTADTADTADTAKEATR
ncbi:MULTISPECIES: ATP-binding cassette domain-containing protein [unclassified Microbacterium]|uniref:ATP-binding cassette domain-containing protein n=1 Tax=unclassified Microbacterium TaxID=2609290 RepID=UPI000EAACDDF|nr:MULTISPECIES: ATP-binding cassette domain-containing protein [unclassified Microbacterium]MBT2483109.1 ATP-binding cassette domain-containing protein [Microbacterium sp. ISL-108]RKN66170.1 ATP-binding cassette domain-containing protein [Microbacterium sp. CGR2]